MKYTDFEKQLMVISYFGITISHSDGHRWIELNQDYDGYLSLELENAFDNHEIRHKNYGGVKGCVDVIERWLFMKTEKKLIELFDELFGKTEYTVEN